MVTFPGTYLELSEKPVRRVITRGSVRHNGRFASRKMGRTIPWESSNELAFLALAELDADVTHVYAQPLKIIRRDASGPGRHYPDYAVVRRGAVEVHEVKRDAAAFDPKVVEVAAWASRYCHRRGATYGVAFEGVLKAEPTRTSAAAVLRRLHDRVDEAVAAHAIAHMARQGVMELGGLADWLARWGGTVETVLTLVAHNRLCLDLRLPVARPSPVWSVEAFPRYPRALPFAAIAGVAT